VVKKKKAESAVGVACQTKIKAVGNQIDFWVIAWRRLLICCLTVCQLEG